MAESMEELAARLAAEVGPDELAPVLRDRDELVYGLMTTGRAEVTTLGGGRITALVDEETGDWFIDVVVPRG